MIYAEMRPRRDGVISLKVSIVHLDKVNYEGRVLHKRTYSMIHKLYSRTKLTDISQHHLRV